MPAKQQVTLPADVFDALELSALVHGGIGGGSRFIGENPCCIVGHAQFLDGAEVQGPYYYNTDSPVISALRAAFGVDGHEVASRNDDAVKDTVTFGAWCKRLNVVRGDA